MSDIRTLEISPWIDARCSNSDFQRFLGVTSAEDAATEALARCTEGSSVNPVKSAQLKQDFLAWLEKDLGLPPGSAAASGLE
jgi:hypothetical protein